MKLFNEPIFKRTHPTGSGTQKVYRFKNGYGASVVRFNGSYTDNKNQWELAVVKFKNDSNKEFELKYDTGITDDVIGYLTENEVEENLQKIKSL